MSHAAAVIVVAAAVIFVVVGTRTPKITAQWS